MRSVTRALFPASVLVLSSALGLFGCAEKVAGADQSPSESLKHTLEAAKKKDVEGYKKGLSKNFQLVIERYQELGESQEELKGAFSYPIFMNAMALSNPVPNEEIIKGNKAVVRALDSTGKQVKTNMILEDGVWRVDVPPSMVLGLDHFDEIAAMAKGEQVQPKPDLPQGGGGKADRAKNLPPDASAYDKKKAVALDMFDLGDLGGATKSLEEVYAENKDDEEVAVALGRVYTQQSKGTEAMKLLADFVTRHPESAKGRHYVGMAYMFEGREDLAAANWRKIVTDHPDYAAEHKLEKRAEIAEMIWKQKNADPMAPPQGEGGGAPASQPAH